MSEKKVFFASDVHLGAPYLQDKKEHELRFLRWLNFIQPNCKELYLMGDIFDFWWEYKRVVPKGFVRILGKLAEFTDSGIPVHFFIGNHDIWTFGYLEKECGLKVYRKQDVHEIDGKKFFLAHGDGLYEVDPGFKIMRSIFHNRFIQQLFSSLVPSRLALKLATGWSGESRKHNTKIAKSEYKGESNEYLIKYAKLLLQEAHYDFFIFGHRHVVLDLALKKDSRILILGDWVQYFTYAEYANGKMLYQTFEEV